MSEAWADPESAQPSASSVFQVATLGDVPGSQPESPIVASNPGFNNRFPGLGRRQTQTFRAVSQLGVGPEQSPSVTH